MEGLLIRGTLQVGGSGVNETHENITRQEAYEILNQWTNYEDELTFDEFDDGCVGIFTDCDVEGLWTPSQPA